MLVVVENRNIAAFLEPALNLEAARCGDILQIDPAEAAREQADGVDDVIDFLGTHAQRDCVHVAERLEQRAFALHNRHAGFGADVAEAEHRRTVGDHRHQIRPAGQFIALVDVFLDLQAGLGDTGGIREGEVVPRLERRAADHFDLAFPFLVLLQ